ncbi:MAG TPA: hypothetical protein PLD27_04010 [bacterium]|nr:hypothetical protein [bacterium]HOL47794.1 hypothetical protein [bacterium]HPQ18629.1 hypothetical protein [bacterium]
MNKKFLFLLLIFLYLINTKIFALKIFLKKGTIIPKTRIVTDKRIFPEQKNVIEIEAVFGSSYGRTIIDKDEITDIKIEDENIIQPVIIEAKNNIIFDNPFILEKQKKTKLILPYTTLTTDSNAIINIGLDDIPAFKILPLTKIYFDFEIKGIKNRYVKKDESEEVEDEIKEKYNITLLEGEIIGLANENGLPDGFDIFFPNKCSVKIISESFYLKFTSEKLIIAVGIGSIVFTDESTQSVTIESGKLAEVNFNKEEYIVINSIEKNQTIKNKIQIKN